MGRIYLSGPMTGIPEFNYPAFNAAADVLRAEGLEVVNPAEAPKQDSWAAYMRHDKELLKNCTEVVLLPGWEKSRGARIEVKWAKAWGLPVREL